MTAALQEDLFGQFTCLLLVACPVHELEKMSLTSLLHAL